MRVIGALYWAILLAVAGAVLSVAYGWIFGWPLPQSALVGAVVVGFGGGVYGFFKKRNKSQSKTHRGETKYNLETCAWCNGTGKEGKDQHPCSVCYGQGNLLARQPSNQCPKCKGKGRLLLGRRCNVCYGAGWETYAHLDGADVQRPKQGRTRVVL